MSKYTIKTARSWRTLFLCGVGSLAIVAIVGGMISSAPAVALTEGPTQQSGSIAPNSFADVVQMVKGAVVSVKVKLVEKTPGGEVEVPELDPNDPSYPNDSLEHFFHRFGDRSPLMPQVKPHTSQALGSGFIISSDGYVVTNNHVVENAAEVILTLDDGKTVPAVIIGSDKKTDLALLKIKSGGDYPYVEFASIEPRVGDWVIAVGNPFGLGGTVTAGIVSARGRDIGSGPYDDYLQIDAPVNRGNSGGPSFNGQGRVVGVNTAIFSPSGGSIGIGFAIPTSVAKSVIESLKTNGTVARGWLGVEIQPVTGDIAESLGLPANSGALVAEAQSTSPAARAGIKAGDVITSVNGEKISNPHELAVKIAGLGPDKSIQLGYVRDGNEKAAELKLGRLPGERQVNNESNTQERSSFKSLGLVLMPQGKGKDGVVVAGVEPDGQAAQSGMKLGDVILDIGGKPISNTSDITAAMENARKMGRKAILLQVQSGYMTHFVALGIS